MTNQYRKWNWFDFVSDYRLIYMNDCPAISSLSSETRSCRNFATKIQIRPAEEKRLDYYVQTMVRKMPNSGFMSTLSPSEKMNCLRRSLRALNTIAICWAATDNTGKSMRLNSSKQPQDPLCARPAECVECVECEEFVEWTYLNDIVLMLIHRKLAELDILKDSIYLKLFVYFV